MRRCVISLLTAITVCLLGCTPAPESSTLSITTDDYTPSISVTGKLSPVKWLTVSSKVGGWLVNLTVKQGEVVDEGDVLGMTDNREYQVAVKQAEATLAIAEAQLAQIQAGPRNEDITVAENQVILARTAISQSVAQRDLLMAGGYSSQSAILKAQLAAAQTDRFIANQQHEDSMKCYDVEQPDGTKDRICPTLGTIEEQTRMVLQAADAALISIETQLDNLYREYRAQLKVADAAILSSQAQTDLAVSQLVMAKATPAPEAVSVAEAYVTQAQVAVDMAQLALEDTLIRAPISGTVGYIYVNEGELISPGAPMLILGDTTNMRVETTDLDEIDVTQIDIGQSAVITFEAIPDEIFTGVVNYIAPMASPGGGGVNYTVYISLDNGHPLLRWGMTAFIDISLAD